MILPDVREAALDLVARALREALGPDPLLRQQAENLVAIAVKYRIDIDRELVGWIHQVTPSKQWTAAEFRRWAECVHALRMEQGSDDDDGRKAP